MSARTLAEDEARTRTELGGPCLQTRAPMIELAGVAKVYRMGRLDSSTDPRLQATRAVARKEVINRVH